MPKTDAYLPYAGIGSRETPPAVQARMTHIARRLAEEGFTLRSGAADGADAAFERGARQVSGRQPEIFLPWRGFNRHASLLWEPERPEHAIAIAERFHPAWTALPSSVRRMMARNCRQVLGPHLDAPSLFVVCYTADGCESPDTRTRRTGGTGMAIAVACHYGIPVVNLAHPDAERRLTKIVRDRLDSLVSPGTQKENEPDESAIGQVYTANQRDHGELPKSAVPVRIDRPSGSVLQNRHAMRSRTATERARVIALNKADLDQDRKQDGPMTRELRRIAELVADGQEVALMCWCSPLPCHGDHYAERIRAMAREMALSRPASDTMSPGA